MQDIQTGEQNWTMIPPGKAVRAPSSYAAPQDGWIYLGATDCLY